MKSLPDGWAVEGLWRDHEYTDAIDNQTPFTDNQIGHADAIVVSYVEDGWEVPEYVTIHGADDWDSLYDLVDDYDESSYFG